MRQKIGIIQALQHDPELAILDEPTEGLDPLMQRAFYEILDERRAAGRTIFFSSHVLSEVERVCDRVAIIRAGRLVALANVEELLARRKRHVEIRYGGEPPGARGRPGRQRRCTMRDGLRHLPARGRRRAVPGRDPRGAPVTDLTIEPARLEEAFLEFYSKRRCGPGGERGVNGTLFRRTIAAYRVRFLACAIGMLVWGLLLPVIYASFGKTLARLPGRQSRVLAVRQLRWW